jgi:hypothetical protein
VCNMPFRIIPIGVVVAASMCVSSIGNAAGAYAVGRSDRGSWGGGARDAVNYADASRDALLHCTSHGPNCTIVAYFSRKCFSLAIPPGTGGYFWATRDTVSESSQAAMQHCAVSGRFCEIKVALCDVRGLAEAAIQPHPLPSAPDAQFHATAELPQANETGTWSSTGLHLLFLLAGAAIVGLVLVSLKRSSSVETGYSDFAQTAQAYDDEAERFRSMGRKLDAETDLADSLIKAKRTRAELDDIEEMFRAGNGRKR